MVDVYDHRYVRVCHKETEPNTKLKDGYWRDPLGWKQPVGPECVPVQGRGQEPHYQADVHFDFWDVRSVAPLLTKPGDTAFEVRKFTVCAPQHTFTNWHEWVKGQRPAVADIGEEHLVTQFVIAPACRPEDLCREHVKLLKKMLRCPGLVEAKTAAWAGRQPRVDYVREFLQRCRIIVEGKVPERSRQPEENAHVSPKERKGKKSKPAKERQGWNKQ